MWYEVEKMKKAKKNNAVIIAGSILTIIVFACVFCRFFMTKDPTWRTVTFHRIKSSFLERIRWEEIFFQ